MDSFTPSGAQFVAVHIGLAPGRSHPILAKFFPADNWIGAMLASHVLSGAVERAGLLVTRGGCVGALADAVFFAQVSDATAAVEILRLELAACGLTELSQIAVREAAGWRAVYPMAGVPVDFLFDTDRHDAAFEDFKSVGREWGAQLREFCRQARELSPHLSGPDKPFFDASLAKLESTLRDSAAAFAPTPPDPEENPS